MFNNVCSGDVDMINAYLSKFPGYKGYKMQLFESIKAHQLRVRKDKNVVAAALLTTLIGEVTALAKKDNREVNDLDVTKTVKRFLDGNKEMLEAMKRMTMTIENYERLKNCLTEAKILEGYMPKQIPEDELTAIIKKAIAEGSSDLKTAMAYLKTNHAGLYDGKMASNIIKHELEIT